MCPRGRLHVRAMASHWTDSENNMRNGADVIDGRVLVA